MAILLRGLVRLLKLLTRSPIVFILSLYMSVVYGMLYLFFTALDTVYIGQYHWHSELTGLLYIGMGIGFMCTIIVVAKLSDDTVVRITKANGGVFEPEMRLPACVFFGCFIPITFFWYSWAMEKDAHWIVPIIGLFPFGFSIMG
jgi:predicted MFS family arabinose efflux permease